MKMRFMKSIKLSFVLFALSALAIFIIPITNGMSEPMKTVTGYVLGGIFWFFLFAGIFSVFYSSKLRKRVEKKLDAEKIEKKRIGLISFSRSISHILVYTLWIIGVALTVTDMIFTYMPAFAATAVVSLSFFLFVFHCIADGKNYCIYKIIKEGIENANSKQEAKDI